MKAIWEKFENYLLKETKEAYDDLNSGASKEQIDALEVELNIKFPKDFREFLMIHNGSKEGFGLIDCFELLSLEGIKSEWDIWQELLEDESFEFDSVDDYSYSEFDDRVKRLWWNPKWIPFASDGSGNSLCIDLDPSESGKIGQVIVMNHEDAGREVLGESFKSWFEGYVLAVLEGKYIYKDEYKSIVDINYQ